MAKRFVKDQRGAMVEKFAIAAGLVGLAAVALGSTIEHLASNGEMPTFAFLTPDQSLVTKAKQPNFDSVDYTATGSISGRVVLDPCTGQQKSP
jgi:hypothetical protein